MSHEMYLPILSGSFHCWGRWRMDQSPFLRGVVITSPCTSLQGGRPDGDSEGFGLVIWGGSWSQIFDILPSNHLGSAVSSWVACLSVAQWGKASPPLMLTCPVSRGCVPKQRRHFPPFVISPPGYGSLRPLHQGPVRSIQVGLVVVPGPSKPCIVETHYVEVGL